jgi:hypothetical protein
MPAIWAIDAWEALSTVFTGPLTVSSLGWSVVLCTVVISDGICGWIVVRQGLRGPLLAANSSGLWLRRTPWSGTAFFVRWSAVDAIRSSRQFFTRMVEIDVHAELSPISVPLGFSDDELLVRTLRHLGHFRPEGRTADR